MTDINDSELRIICQYITGAIPTFYSVMSDFVNDLYTSGCRPQELLQFDRWVQSGGDVDSWELTPEKGNNVRTIKKVTLSDNLNFAIVNQIKPYNGLTQRQLEYAIQQLNPIGIAFSEDWPIIAYMYRYNRVRQYLDDGKTQAQISSIFGWVAPTIIATYTTRQLSILFNLIPDETYLLQNSNVDTIIDSDDTFVVSE